MPVDVADPTPPPGPGDCTRRDPPPSEPAQRDEPAQRARGKGGGLAPPRERAVRGKPPRDRPKPATPIGSAGATREPTARNGIVAAERMPISSLVREREGERGGNGPPPISIRSGTS